MKEFVIAHYLENLDWVPESGCFTIYEKYEGANKLPNVGREAHTFIHHIVHRWTSLEYITVFAQGDPFPHCRNFLEATDQLCEWFVPLGDEMVECCRNGGTWPDHDMEAFHKRVTGTWRGNFQFAAGGQFMATRECLQSVPLDQWKTLLSIAETEYEFPWYMERTWGRLLSLPDDGQASA